jgi:hypothetical protein
LAVLGGLVFGGGSSAGPIDFTLLTHADNAGILPQHKGEVTVSGDHLLHTDDDITGATFNPDGCFSFNFTNPVGIQLPDYPPGYAEGIHSMTGTLVLDVDLHTGGAVGVSSLAFDGYVSPSKYSAQWLIRPGDPAADGNHGPLNGAPNSGTYAASAAADWALAATFDWYYDTPYAGAGTIDMTFNDYAWGGFIIPVSELTPAGMAATALDDPLGFYPGTSEDFEAWLLAEVAPRLPADARYLLFAQGEAHPDWTDPAMGMTTDGIVGATILAYTTVPEPATLLLTAVGAGAAALWRQRKRSWTQ